jgi:hypothetical protein
MPKTSPTRTFGVRSVGTVATDREKAMGYFNEYALLIAAAVPVLVIVGMQVFLFVKGERGTLLLPGISRYPSIVIAEDPAEPVLAAVEGPVEGAERLAA